jgi:hypothetical protein
MLVINAEINRFPFFSSRAGAKIKEFCKTLDIMEPLSVYTTEELRGNLTNNLEESILLFSNFPPDSSYPDSGMSRKNYRKDELGYPSLESDSYTRSLSFFTVLCLKYKFKAIHFITAAPEEKLSDDRIRSLSGIIPITVTRKKEWIHQGRNYEQMCSLFMIQKIREAVLEDFIA